jgi:hypothetical protein
VQPRWNVRRTMKGLVAREFLNLACTVGSLDIISAMTT